jgi:iron complex outermembrane recepter protein
MIFQRKKVASALAYMLGVGGAVSLIAAPAQAADIKVDVTGSNIKRVEGEGALPVQVITREEIERTGSQSAIDILNYVSANNTGGQISIANTIGASTFSVQTASLRGLGGQNTLVLINGKRVTQSSGEVQGVYGVNLDVIPFSAIERVEILRDGASAVYGSDAVGGVINFILRQDFTGVEATAYYGGPTRGGGGGEIGSAALTAGWGDLNKDKFNIFGSFYYQKANALDQNKRNFSDSSYDLAQGLVGVSGNTFPAYITTGGIGSLSYPNCDPSIPIPGGEISANSRCFYDPAAAPGVQGIPEVTTYSFYGSGRYQINRDWQAYLTGSYAKVENNFVIQPTPLSDQILYGPNGDIPATFLLQPSSPYYPTAAAIAAGVNGQPLNLRYRAYGLGLRDQTDTNEQWQAVLGVKGSAWDWDMDFDFAYSHSQTTERPNGGFARYSDIVPLLNSGQVNPFGASSPAIEAQIQALQFTEQAFKGESQGYVFEAKGSRDIYNLPAGPLGMAIGGQVGRQELTQTFNPALQAGDVTGYGGNFLNIDASRNFWSLFTEFNIPIVKTLEATAAVRYDNYSDFGSTTNPKFAVRWTPIQQLLFRGSWGTSFVAPTLTQAYGANTSGLSQAGLEDPLRCPTTQDTNDCLTQFTLRFGGNPDLQPQKSNQWQAGFLLEPAPGVSFGVDYFSIDLKNLFSNGVTPETILNDQAQYGYLITRGPVQPQYPTIPGPITSIDQRFINLGEVKIRGFDVDARAVLPPTAFGRFVLSLNGTYYITYDQQQPDGSFAGFVSNAFGSATSGITPRYKQYATVNWSYGPWSATLGNTYVTSYIDAGTDGNDEIRRVGSLSLWDLYGSYTGLKNWKFVLGAKNIWDTNPPFTNQRTTFQSGYDPTQYDARSRFIYGSITYTFK